MKKQSLITCAFVFLAVSAIWGQQQKGGHRGVAEASVVRRGNSSLVTAFNEAEVRVVVGAYQIDIVRNGTPPDERKNNCTYSSFPCSQISSLQISVNGTKLFVLRSVFADCADVFTMRLTKEQGVYVLTLNAGDASEAYSVKIYFTADQVKKREIYDGETSTIRESTTYVPPTVVN